MKDRPWSISARSRTALDSAAPLKDRFIRYWPWPYGRMQNVQGDDELGRTPIAQEFQRAAVDETKRLLYVSMTRA